MKAKRLEAETIAYCFGKTALGPVLVAQSEKGICAVLIDDSAASLRDELRRRFPKANLKEGRAGLERIAAKIIRFIENPRTAIDVRLDIRGTDFQKRVWDALQRIPVGDTVSYSDIARELKAPNAVRAVGSACGANHLAVLIPCHRVLTSSGGISGYYWGVERKRKLLEVEGVL